MKYNFSFVEEDLKIGINEVIDQLGFVDAEDGISVFSQIGSHPAIKKGEKGITITYSKKYEFFRMLSMLENPQITSEYEETPHHDSLCYMVDQSRNAVLKPDEAKRLVRYLALSGYDSMMLYTEDTYEVEGEKYFGYMRGKWTKAQIRELDDYCLNFGIELIPCIQTLGHMERVMRWGRFREISDVLSILLAGDERTYELIDKMFAACRESYRSDKINIGMDEATLIGLGKYLHKNGYKNRAEIMTDHLKRVLEIAEKYGFKAMMWCDMFFSLAFKGNYHVTDGEIPQDIIDMVPENVTLIYWDYYTDSAKEVNHMAGCLKKFKNKSAFAGGLQRWARFTPVNEFSIAVEEIHLEECFKQGIKDIIATAWGDDGSESSTFGIMPTLVFYGEKCYKRTVERDWLEQRLLDVCNTSMKPFTEINDMDYLPGFPKLDRGGNRFTKVPLYADLLAAQYYKHVPKEICMKHYYERAEGLKPYLEDKSFGYVFDVIYKLALLCAKRVELINDIRTSYVAGDKERLEEIAKKDIPEAVSLADDFIVAFVAQWKKENRNPGLEVHQIRLGGMRQRMLGVGQILLEYVEGKTQSIDELEEETLFADCREENSSEPFALFAFDSVWKNIVTVNGI